MIYDFLKTCKCVLPGETDDYKDILEKFKNVQSVAVFPMITMDFWPIDKLEDDLPGRVISKGKEESTYVIPLCNSNFFAEKTFSEMVSLFYKDEQDELFEKYSDFDCDEMILLHTNMFERSYNIAGVEGVNVAYAHISTYGDNDVNLIFVLNTTDECWVEMIEEFDIKTHVLIHSHKGFGDWLISTKLYEMLKITKKPELLPGYYFTGKCINENYSGMTVVYDNEIDGVNLEIFAVDWNIFLKDN